MNKKLLMLVWVALPLAAAAQISYNGGTYMQDFNTLESGVIYRKWAASLVSRLTRLGRGDSFA